jgi:hypothetical protein
MLTGLIALALAVPPELPWPGVVGSGLLTPPDTATLAQRRFMLAAGINNKDRDRLGINVCDGQAIGGGRFERCSLVGHAAHPKRQVGFVVVCGWSF